MWGLGWAQGFFQVVILVFSVLKTSWETLERNLHVSPALSRVIVFTVLGSSSLHTLVFCCFGFFLHCCRLAGYRAKSKSRLVTDFGVKYLTGHRHPFLPQTSSCCAGAHSSFGRVFIRVAPGHDEPNSLGKKSGEELCLPCFGWGFFFFSLLECYFLLIVTNRRVGKRAKCSRSL